MSVGFTLLVLLHVYAAKAEAPPLQSELVKMGGQRSPFKSCEKVIVIDSENWKTNQEFWDRYGKSKECADSLQVVPTTGMFKEYSGSLRESLSGSVTAIGFLSAVGNRVVKDMSAEIEDLKKFKKCFEKSQSRQVSALQCEKDKEIFLQPIREHGVAFRKNLAMIKEPDMATEFTGLVRDDASVYVNQIFTKEPGTLSPPKIQALTAKEKQEVLDKANTAYQAAKAAYAQSVNKTINDRNLKGEEAQKFSRAMQEPKAKQAFIHAKMQEFRAQNLQEHLKFIRDTPQLGYVASASISDADLNLALEKMIEDATEAREDSQKALASRKLDFNSEKMDSSLLRFAAYTKTIEKMLKEQSQDGKPANCAVATAVFNELASVKSQGEVVSALALITGPIAIGLLPRTAGWLSRGSVVISATGAGAVAAGVGIAGGLGLGLKGVNESLEAERNVKLGLTRPEDVESELIGGPLSVATAPLDLFGAKVAIGGFAGLAGWALAHGQASKLRQLAKVKPEVSPVGEAIVSQVNKVAELPPTETKKILEVIAKEDQSASQELAEGQKLISEAVAGNKKAVQKVEEKKTQIVKDLLGGRTPSRSENALIDSLYKKGLLGDGEKLNIDLIENYAYATRRMSDSERDTFAKKFRQTIDGFEVPSEVVSEVERTAIQRRNTVSSHLAFEYMLLDKVAPREVMKILNDKDYTTETLFALKTVLERTRLNGITTKLDPERYKSVISEMRFGSKGYYRNLSSSAQKIVDRMCECMGVCPVTAQLNVKPVYMICAK